MQDQARQIWDRIESSTNQIMEQNMEAAEQYEQTLKQLDQINQTVHFLLNLTNSLRTEVDQKLGWLTNYIGDTGKILNNSLAKEKSLKTNFHFNKMMFIRMYLII